MSAIWPRSRRWGYAAGAWAGAFACLHYFWALGGQAGLSVSSGQELATHRPTWFVVVGLWGVGTLCLIGAGLGVLLARPDAQSDSPGLLHRGIRCLGWVVSALLLVRGALVEVLLLTNVTHLDTDISAGQRFWTLMLWNPWFIAGGVVFGVAAVNFKAKGPTPPPAG